MTGELACCDLGWSVDGRWALKDVTADFAPGLCTAVIGTNGSGKTTLLHLLGGLRRPTAGRVTLEGRPLSKTRRREVARRIALMEQIPESRVDLTVRDVVVLGRIPHTGRWGRLDQRRGDSRIVDEVMARIGVDVLADRSWNTLSGGERQWVQLARTLAQEPHILLLDEPTNHLDLAHQIALLRAVTSLGLTTVVVLHDLDLAAAFADELLVLDHGRLVAHGPTDEVLDASLVARCFGVSGEVTHAGRRGFSWHGLVTGP